jgi:hypothetical protein
VEGATRPTVAVRVNGWPVTIALGDDVSVVVVAKPQQRQRLDALKTTLASPT